MDNRKKVITGFVMAGAALATLVGAGVAGGIAAADTEDSDGKSMLDRIAEKLGIESSALESAVKSARKDARTEALSDRLAKAVEAGTITQEEADAISAWVESAPDALESLKAGKGPRGVHGFMGPRGGGLGLFVVPHAGPGPLLGAMDPERLAERLSALVEAGTLTQEEADAVTAWFESRPSSIDELAPQKPEGVDGQGFGPMRGRGPGGHGFGGRGGHGHGFILPGPGYDGAVPQIRPETGTGTSTSASVGTVNA